MRIAAGDGTEVLAASDGTGPGIVVLHGGMNDESAWRRVAERLTGRFQVVRMRRRRYRADLTPPPGLAAEVADTVALARSLGRPVLLVGHSSGAVVALEALLAEPAAFAGAVLYEPPVVTEQPLGGEAIRRAQAALAAGSPRRAIQIFLRDVVRLPPRTVWPIAALLAMVPRWRWMIPRQIDDNLAIDALGDRRAAYAGIRVPVLLLGGDRSPGHLADRLAALEAAIPGAERTTMPGQGHGANLAAPAEVARIVAGFADRTISH
ncbi:alpha/beta fold hydrolase [Actinoplanes ianthinogenes]|nr:alpha/beta hydrolase [Actinoplanes ianthinogenes]